MKLAVPWLDVQRKTVISCYEGKRLPKASCSARQLLPVFPECLEEAILRNPFSVKNPAQGLSDWPGMEAGGFAYLPPLHGHGVPSSQNSIGGVGQHKHLLCIPRPCHVTEHSTRGRPIATGQANPVLANIRKVRLDNKEYIEGLPPKICYSSTPVQWDNTISRNR